MALLEFVRDLPRTEANIAAVLVDRVGKPAPLPEVKAALERLVEAQFVRDTEEGYKLQTAQEKSWEQEKRGFDPRPKEQEGDPARDPLGDLRRAEPQDLQGLAYLLRRRHGRRHAPGERGADSALRGGRRGRGRAGTEDPGGQAGEPAARERASTGSSPLPPR